MGDLGLLGMGMPRSPEELGLLLSMDQVRGMSAPMSAGNAYPFARNMMGQIPAGAFSPKDLLMTANLPMRGAGMLGRGMPAVLDPAERMFAPSLWSIVRGL